MGAKQSREDAKIEDYWTIKRLLGQGSYSKVRRCIRKSDGFEAAVKIIRKLDLAPGRRSSTDPDFDDVVDVHKESQIIKRINHPNCIKLYDMFVSKRHVYVVTELCAGGSVYDEMDEDKGLDETKVARIIKQLVPALMHLHENGIIYKHLRGDKLMYENANKETIKIRDYGLSSLFFQNAKLIFNAPNHILYYSAPEIFSGDPITPACDFWSVGILIYVLLVGYLPFYREKSSETLMLIREAKYDFDPVYWSCISEHAKDLIKNLLIADSAKRLSGQEILNHPFVARGLREAWLRTFFEHSEIHEDDYCGWIYEKAEYREDMKHFIPFYSRYEKTLPLKVHTRITP